MVCIRRIRGIAGHDSPGKLDNSCVRYADGSADSLPGFWVRRGLYRVKLGNNQGDTRRRRKLAQRCIPPPLSVVGLGRYVCDMGLDAGAVE